MFLAAPKVARAARFVNVLLNLALVPSPFFIKTSGMAMLDSIFLGLLLKRSSFPKEKTKATSGNWDAYTNQTNSLLSEHKLARDRVRKIRAKFLSDMLGSD